MTLYAVRLVAGEWRVISYPYDHDLERKPLVFRSRRQAEAVKKEKVQRATNR